MTTDGRIEGSIQTGQVEVGERKEPTQRVLILRRTGTIPVDMYLQEIKDSDGESPTIFALYYVPDGLPALNGEQVVKVTKHFYPLGCGEALNRDAAIEAGRAEAQRKGFTIVEVRDLQ